MRCLMIINDRHKNATQIIFALAKLKQMLAFPNISESYRNTEHIVLVYK